MKRNIDDCNADAKLPCQFRPADPTDFKCRVEALSKLLKCDAEDAQELLARIYGYKDSRDLMDALKTPGAPGPYTDTSALGHEAVLDDAARLRMRCNQRTVVEVVSWIEAKGERAVLNDDLLACDLGLFLSPALFSASKKVVFRHVKSRKKGVTPEGFPVGFNGAIFGLYRCKLTLDEDSFKDFEFPSDWFADRGYRCVRPDVHLRYMQFERAADIFLNLMPKAALSAKDEGLPPIPGWWPRPDAGDGAPLFLMQCDFSREIYSFLRKGDAQDAEGGDAWEAGYREFLEVLKDPCAERISSCRWTMNIPNLCEKLGVWRLHLRKQVAKAWSECREQRAELGTCPQLLNLSKPGMRCSVLFQEEESEVNIQQWTVVASYLRQDDEGAPWKLAGVLAGDYVLPHRGRSYIGAPALLDHFECTDDFEMLKAWSLLTRLYLPRVGTLAYRDWVHREDCALVNLRVCIAPEWRGNGELPEMLDAFTQIFDSGSPLSVDAHWRTWGNLAVELDDWGPELFEECPLHEVGVCFFPMHGSGILATSVWDEVGETATSQVLRKEGDSTREWRGPLARLGYSTPSPETPCTALARHVLNAVKGVPMDVVIYDPSDDSTDGDAKDD